MTKKRIHKDIKSLCKLLQGGTMPWRVAHPLFGNNLLKKARRHGFIVLEPWEERPHLKFKVPIRVKLTQHGANKAQSK